MPSATPVQKEHVSPLRSKAQDVSWKMGQKTKNLLPIRTFHSKTIKKHFHGRMPIPSCGTKYIFRSFLQSSAFLCITHKRLPAIPFAPGCTARKKPPFLDASMSEMSPREVDFCAQLCQAYLLVKSVTAFCRIATVANSPPIRPWFARHPTTVRQAPAVLCLKMKDGH